MSKFTSSLKRIILILPVATIAGTSVLSMPTWCHQALVLFALIWFNTFILFDVLGK